MDKSKEVASKTRLVLVFVRAAGVIKKEDLELLRADVESSALKNSLVLTHCNHQDGGLFVSLEINKDFQAFLICALEEGPLRGWNDRLKMPAIK